VLLSVSLIHHPVNKHNPFLQGTNMFIIITF